MKRRCWPTFVLLLALIAVAAVANARGETEARLSLQQALDQARAQNPELLIQRADQARAEAVQRQTLQGVLPTLSVDATHLRLDTSLLEDVPGLEPGLPPVIVRRDLGPLEGQIVGVQLIQPLINLGAWNARRQAERQTAAARLSVGRAEDEVALAVIEGYFGARTAERQVTAERRGLATAERALRQAEGAFAEGLVPRVDVLRARTRVLDMEARVATAEALVVSAQAQLRQVLGLEGGLRLQLTDPVPEPSGVLPSRPIQAEWLAERQDLRALEQTLGAARFGVRRARAAYVPDVNLLLRYQDIDLDRPLDLEESGWLVAVNLRWTPFAGLAQAGAVAEARAREHEARAQWQALRQRAWAEAESAQADWQAEWIGWQRASSGVEEAEAALALTEGRYAEGLDDMTSLLQAQAEELGAITREINARFSALVAAERYRLAVAAGEPGEHLR